MRLCLLYVKLKNLRHNSTQNRSISSLEEDKRQCLQCSQCQPPRCPDSEASPAGQASQGVPGHPGCQHFQRPELRPIPSHVTGQSRMRTQVSRLQGSDIKQGPPDCFLQTGFPPLVRRSEATGAKGQVSRLVLGGWAHQRGGAVSPHPE